MPIRGKAMPKFASIGALYDHQATPKLANK